MAASILLLGVFLALTGAGLLEQWRASAAHRQAADVDDFIGLLATATGLGIVAWWMLSILVATAGAILERHGRRSAAAAADRFCPAFMRRLTMAVFSVQLVAVPMAHAADSPPGPAWIPAQELSLPADPAASVAWGSTARETDQPVPAADLQPGWRPHTPVTEPGLLAAPPVRAVQVATGAGNEVAVLSGDTLWDIAARELGPAATDVEVALQWPRWYAANRGVIGENPDVLLPGQILKSPSAA
ncbi:LysM peptidoglycan-binding domain-containing protein [Arthrobacter sp. CDRTa11]|uniref:LysM peptidoglycan-binding domain-containing protein n=1 Tax=Arthrobacter sp. CDRTa11 TaxID=2651199 RepID=UPI002265CAB2|nr:LysM domain-containing protein [Arthrobacter sp. CDRTa11]UZX03911.1 LysM peptidoglycan-binding domain-containing protein [Arthrobacter sp. CDRTa11]